ncbi:hypothetical protein OROHE_002762 [Orobanche hederae]
MGSQHTTARLNSAILGSGDGSNCCGDRWFAIEGKVPTAKSDLPRRRSRRVAGEGSDMVYPNFRRVRS